MWKVTQLYYDSGRIVAYAEKAEPDDKVISSEKHEHYDLYVDLFLTEKKARQFAFDCQNNS